MSSMKKRLKARLGQSDTSRSGSNAWVSDEDDDDELFGSVSNRKSIVASSPPTQQKRRSVGGSSSGEGRQGQQQRTSAQMSAASTGSVAAWGEAEKMIYEQQLELLQEQLESVMIEKEKLAQELREIQALDVANWAQQLQRERQRSLELSLQVEDLQQRSHGVGASSSDGSDVDGWVPVNLAGQPMASLPEASSGGVRRRHQPDGDAAENATGSTTPPPLDRIDSEETEQAETGAVSKMKNYALSKAVAFLCDFTVDGAYEEDDVDPEELSFNRLKSNWKRFWDDAKPIYSFFKSIDQILHWEQWTTSLACFLLYMYSVWLGLLVPSALFGAIAYLSYTYLKNSGILSRFSASGPSSSSGETEDTGSSSSSSSRSYWQLVTQVAQKVQNTSGDIGDSLEKFYNLLAWHHPKATQKLYTALWIFFLVSCVLPEAVVFRIAGLFLGYKFFVERSVYRRFPKVKAKYDTVARIWKQLPTNAQLESFIARRQARLSNPDDEECDGAVDSGGVTAADSQFCERFGLPMDQRPLDGWKSGCHCRLIDKDKPLTSFAISGKMYMTAGYLCFERSRSKRDTTTEGDVKIALTDVADIKKAKAFARLPGSGMAIEVQPLSGGKPYIFGAILNRTEVLQQILAAGRRSNLPWATRASSRPSQS